MPIGMQQPRVSLPSRAEAREIVPTIREEFAKAGKPEAAVVIVPRGGIMVRTGEMPEDTANGIQCGLFARGIVMVAVRPGEWGIAIRR